MDVNRPRDPIKGMTPLHMAVKFDRRDAVVILLKAGADRNKKCLVAHPLNALQYACKKVNLQNLLATVAALLTVELGENHDCSIASTKRYST